MLLTNKATSDKSIFVSNKFYAHAAACVSLFMYGYFFLVSVTACRTCASCPTNIVMPSSVLRNPKDQIASTNWSTLIAGDV